MALFKLGQVVATPGAIALLEHHETLLTPNSILFRHVSGDDGDVCEEDKQVNKHAIEHGFRILSSYPVNGETIWIITEADRSSTTILLPSEY